MYIHNYLQSCLLYPQTLDPKVFGWINKACGLMTLYYTWYQDGSLIKRVECELQNNRIMEDRIHETHVQPCETWWGFWRKVWDVTV